MKNNLIFSLSILFLSLSIFCSGQTVCEKTLQSSFDMEGAMTLITDLPGKVQIKPCDRDQVTVLIHVKTRKASEAIVRYLKSEGRYLVRGQSLSDTGFILTSPNFAKLVKVKGSLIEEEINFEIFVPHYVSVIEYGEKVAARRDLVQM